MRVLIYSKLEINFFTLGKKLVGTSGLEPPTSRLSGVRSNHLSYAPSFLHKHSLCGENVQFVSQTDVWLPVTFVSPSALASLSGSDGGDEEDRTPDPLLAKQVLSQLSYTPMLYEKWWA